MTVGVAETEKIFYSAASGVGNSIVYVGSKTGRDGIHGATMASADFSEDSEEKRPTVQIGDPFAGKLLIEASLELIDRALEQALLVESRRDQGEIEGHAGDGRGGLRDDGGIGRRPGVSSHSLDEASVERPHGPRRRHPTDVVDRRRVPDRRDDAGDRVAHGTGQRARLRHKPVDAEDQSHPSDRDRRNDREGCGKNDEA